jgi:HK97 family phage prohead protease
MTTYETRFTTLCELRMDGDHSFEGYAARFYNRGDEQGTTYRLSRNVIERINRSAFERTISDGHDIRALAYHDRTLPMGRTNTDRLAKLRLWTDEHGLRFSLPYDGDYDVHRSVKAGLRNGAIGGMSFSFNAEPHKGERFLSERGQDYRELTDVDLDEISFVDKAAYSSATSSFRSANEPDTFHTQNWDIEKRYQEWKDTEILLAQTELFIANYIPISE